MYDTRTHVPLWGRSFAVEHKNFEMCHLAQLGIVHRLVPYSKDLRLVYLRQRLKLSHILLNVSLNFIYIWISYVFQLLIVAFYFIFLIYYCGL